MITESDEAVAIAQSLKGIAAILNAEAMGVRQSAKFAPTPATTVISNTLLESKPQRAERLPERTLKAWKSSAKLMVINAAVVAACTP